MAFPNIFGAFKQRSKQLKYAQMLSGYTPVFSGFGENVYASDIVQDCIRCIATEISKLTPKHIRIDSETGMQTVVNSSINRLFKFNPNPLMTTKDYLEKIIWLLELTSNAFIYPTYINTGDTRVYTGLYPLNPRVVEFMNDETETLFVKMTFGNGQSYTLPYADIIHLRKDYSLSDIMGGDESGMPINKSLLKVLETENTVIQGIGNAIKASLAVRVILKQNSLLNEEKMEEEKQKFLEAIKNNESGILPMDLKSEYTPIPIDPKLIDKDTMQFLQSKVLNNYGVSLPILSGDYTEEQYQAFYGKTLEAIIMGLGQAHSKTLFTERELQFGNEVIFYPQRLIFTSTQNKIAVAEILGNRGALMDNQLLELFGYPPYAGGNKRKQSLNFIDCDIANEYQLTPNTKSSQTQIIQAEPPKDEQRSRKDINLSKNGETVLAVDFDGTLVSNEYPKIGRIKQDVFDYVIKKQNEGFKITLWTCREGDSLKEAVNFCAANGLYFDYINNNSDNVVSTFGNDSRKVYATYYLDDRNISLSDV